MFVRFWIQKLIILLAIFFIVLILVAACYTVYQEDMEELSDQHNTYGVVVSEDGSLQYVRQTESGEKETVDTKEVVDQYKEVVDKYDMQDEENEEEYDKKIDYILKAEAVTKLPYRGNITDPNTQQEGTIKFYRYTNSTDNYLMTDNLVVKNLYIGNNIKILSVGFALGCTELSQVYIGNFWASI